MAEPLAIIPNHVSDPEQIGFTLNCVESLKKTAPDLEVLIVDDLSPLENQILRPTLDGLVDKHDGVNVYYKSENTGFAATVNYGLRLAREEGRDAVLVNADLSFIEEGWLEALQQNPADLVGGLLLYPNGLVQHAGTYFSVISRRFHHMYRFAPARLNAVQEPHDGPVSGALQYIRHATLEKVGLYDDAFKLQWEDIDYCQRVFVEGLTCAYEPKCRVIHYEATFDAENEKHDKWIADGWIRLHEKWAGHSFAEYMPTMVWDVDE